jgi:hypothetical protein
MTGFQSKKAAARAKLIVDRTQVEQWLEALKDIDALHHSQEPESVDAQKAIADMGQALAQPEQESTLQEQLDKANADRDKADADWGKANADRDKAYPDWVKANAEVRRIQALMEKQNG